LPDNFVESIAIDNSGTKWIGTNGGLTAFDGTTWTTWNTSNSGLPHNGVTSVVIDSNGTKWIGTLSSLAAFDGTTWATWNTSNSGLPHNWVKSIAIDASATRWIGTGDGLAAFDGANWTTWNFSTSLLHGKFVNSIAIDGSGTKWLGTDGGGMSAFNENGIPVGMEEYKLPSENISIKTFPNPFTTSTTIEFELPQTSIVSIQIFNCIGAKVAELHNGLLPAGQQQFTWDAGDLPKGIYFCKVQTGQKTAAQKIIKTQ